MASFRRSHLLGHDGHNFCFMPKVSMLVVLPLLLALWGGLNHVQGGAPYPGAYPGVETMTQGQQYAPGGHTVADDPMYYETGRPVNTHPPPYPPAGAYAPPYPNAGAYQPGPGYAPPAPQGYAPPTPGAPGTKAEPIQVQVEHVIVQEPDKSGAPIVKGQGLFLLGLAAVIVCLIAMYSDPAAKGRSAPSIVGMNFKSMFQFKDFARSLLVVVTILASPILLGVGIVRLAMTLPQFLVWAWHNDEISFAKIGFMVLYVWLLFLDPAGKSK